MPKKYRKKEEPIARNPSRAMLADWEQDEQDVEVQMNFGTPSNPKNILHLWLYGVIPGIHSERIQYLLSSYKMRGAKEICENKIREGTHVLATRKMKSIGLDYQLHANTIIFMSRRFLCKFYEKKEIDEANKSLKTKYNFKELEEPIKALLKSKYAYLVSIKKQQDQSFSEYFKCFESMEGFIPSRTDIELASENNQQKFSFFKKLNIMRGEQSCQNDEKEQKAINRQSKHEKSQEDDEQQQSSDGDFAQNFYNKSYAFKSPNPIAETPAGKKQQKKFQNQKGVGKKVKKKWLKKQEVQQERRPPKENTIRQQRRNINPKKTWFNEDFDSTVFNIDTFKSWVKNNRVLDLDDFQIIRRDDKKVVTLRLLAREGQAYKLEKLNIFLKFQKCLLLRPQNKTQIKEIKAKYCQQNQYKHVEIKIIEGFKEKNAHEHRLRTLILENKIHKTFQRNQKFAVIWIEGLKPQVDRLNEEISQFVTELPEQDHQTDITFELGNLQHYINEKKVYNLIEKTIKEEISYYKYIKLNKIELHYKKIVAEILVEFDKIDHFEKVDQQRIKKILTDKIVVDEIIDDIKEVTPAMKEKYIIQESSHNPGKGVLISQIKENSKKTKEIVQQISKNHHQIKKKVINYKRGRLGMIIKFIEVIKKDPNLKQFINNVEIRQIETENKMQIMGHGRNVMKVYQTFQEYMENINSSLKQKKLQLNEEEMAVVEKNRDKFISNIGVSFEIDKNVKIGGIITMGEESYVKKNSNLILYILKEKYIEFLPRSTLFFFNSIDDIKFCEDKFMIPYLAHFQHKDPSFVHSQLENKRDFHFLYSGQNNYQKVVDIAQREYLYKNEKSKRYYCFFMPKMPQKQKLLVEALLQKLQMKIQERPTEVYIMADPTINLEQNLHIYSSKSKGKFKNVKKYYVDDQGKQFYYAQSGNAKIQNAIKNGEKLVYLSNSDLNFKNNSHICSFKQQKMIHKLSKNQVDLQIFPDRVTFDLKGKTFNLPTEIQKTIRKQSKANNHWVEVSVGVYEINLIKMIQTNLFSNFERKLLCKEENVPNKFITNVNVDYDYKVNQANFTYEIQDEKKIDLAISGLKQLINSERIEEIYKFEFDLSDEQKGNIESSGNDNNVSIYFKSRRQILISGFELTNIKNFVRMIPFLVSSPNETKFPSHWAPQTQEIEVFIVDKNSAQFAQVQAKFTLTAIKELVRIQNKIVYKKFIDEKNCLKELNEGKQVKEMMLYHGTRGTDPQVIYGDKEQSFNINYTSDYNYLGKGTYFAEKPEYSHNYAYTYPKDQNTGLMNIFGRKKDSDIKYGMFYCSVLVGESQDVPNVTAQSQAMKDTGFKNKDKKIRYESSTTFTNNSVVYAVYKNRRAYPSYLIKY